MNRSTIRNLGFVVKDPIDVQTFWDYCPICGAYERDDGRICSKCVKSLNNEIGE